MTGRYKAYSDYKYSGTSWLGDVPSHWDILPTKRFFRLVAESAPENNDYELLSVYTDIGVKPRKELEQKGNKASTTDGYWMVRKGDIVVNKLLAWMGAVGYSSYDGVTSPAYDILRPTKVFNSRFFHYLFRNEIAQQEFKRWSRGIMEMRLRLYFEELGRIQMPFPPKDEIEKIANFLDHETAKIDTLIAKQEKLIELLKEKRQAVISHAVTKGLNPDAPMKDSGVEWLGEVPNGWEVGSLQYFLNDIGDVDHYMPASVDSGIPYVMTGDLNEKVSEIDFDDCKQVDVADFTKLSKRIKTSLGDIIMARYATIGSVSYVDISKDFLVSYSCVTIKPNPNEFLGLYLFYFFKSHAFLQGIQSHINTNTQGNVGVGDLKVVKVAKPTLNEQKAIVDYLESHLNKIDYLTEKAAQAINLMQERKIALISAAVTGKIDVRDWDIQGVQE